MLFKTLLHIIPLSSLLAHPGYFEPWGKDAGLKLEKKELLQKNESIGAKIADLVIQFHQEVISPVDGPRSHYRPSSSQYMQQAIHNYGFFKGFVMGCDRLLRENDEEWVYPTVQYGDRVLKFDPARLDKRKKAS